MELKRKRMTGDERQQAIILVAGGNIIAP